MGTKYKGVYYGNLKYSTKEINQQFKIKVSGVSNGKKVHMAVGVSGLVRIVGDMEQINDMLDKAFKKGLDKTSRKLRRGLKVTFYSY